MFSARTSAPSLGGLTVNTSSANSLFGANTTSTAPAATTGGSLFGAAATTTQQPQSGGLFSGLGAQNQQQQKPAGGSIFGGTSQQTQPAPGNLFGSTQLQSGGSLFGAGTQQQQQQQQTQQSGGLFGATQQKPTGGSLFGAATSTSQPQSGGSLFGGLGQATATTSTSAGGLFGASQPQQQQQPQPQQGPSLSLFGNRNTTTQAEQRPGGSTVQGVKIDVSNLVPTTKFESCTDELKKEIETIDTFILNQIRMCNEVSDILPTISSQGALVPNDVEFVQGKLDTLQEALETDARGIENARNLVTRDAGEAKLAFRALDNLLLPLQYQPTAADRWLAPSQQSQSLPGRSIRSGLSARHMLALPEDAEADSSLGATGGPTNLVDYFSQRADDMDVVVQKYRKSLKEIEEYLRGVEASLAQQINDLSSRSRDGGAPSHASATRASELAATLGDVETAILGVAGRVGGVREEVQELVLGPLGIGGHGITNGW
ncbi:nucleoporin NUP49/NSP49 [Blastomyces dermatitidis ATCC 18188]|uniref:Nucleoporin NUP49/NSP49 n=1 Tax=Ajellomyces dermatitidis (strain ATCC 18188 / CBS 674.68) TaxID=653446 RepID=F2TCZ4_AJEDA|nr:nucleoporin NUP49/NSP49 [Blastomyces dermatitidis ATCC 18188]